MAHSDLPTAAVTVNIHIRGGATPKAEHTTRGNTRWLDLDSRTLIANLLMPHDPSAAVTYLDALIDAATKLRAAIAADAGLTTAALAT